MFYDLRAWVCYSHATNNLLKLYLKCYTTAHDFFSLPSPLGLICNTYNVYHVTCDEQKNVLPQLVSNGTLVCQCGVFHLEFLRLLLIFRGWKNVSVSYVKLKKIMLAAEQQRTENMFYLFLVTVAKFFQGVADESHIQ